MGETALDQECCPGAFLCNGLPGFVLLQALQGYQTPAVLEWAGAFNMKARRPQLAGRWGPC
jgi:hypothetical protein